MKYYIIAGEASGDLHGSNLIRALREQDGASEIRCWGGDLMQQAGGTLVKHYRDLAFMGFLEVVKNIPAILRNLSFCKEDILKFQPDALILVDYPGFNLRIAAWAKARGIRVIYYISPQIWAWKEGRIRQIRKNIDLMLVILPFEQEYYRQRGMEVVYVGHPLAEVVREAQANLDAAPETGLSPLNHPHIIALLPGSREQEVSRKLPVMLEMSRAFPDYQFVVAKAPSLSDEFYKPFLEAYPQVRWIRNRTYALLHQAKAALVTSGTATLETALFGVPQVVCYKGSTLSYLIARRLVKVRFISLVNLIMDREVVRELIQQDFRADRLRAALAEILYDLSTANRIMQDYAALKKLLEEGGRASENAAQRIVSWLRASRAGKPSI